MAEDLPPVDGIGRRYDASDYAESVVDLLDGHLTEIARRRSSDIWEVFDVDSRLEDLSPTSRALRSRPTGRR